MEVEFKDIEFFKRMMDTIGSLMSDVSLDFNQDGFTIKAMDPANIAMVLFEGNKNIFSTFNVDKEIKLSVSLDDLNSILKMMKKEDKAKFKDSKNRLEIDIRGKSRLHFTIPLIDENYTAQKVPQLNFTAEAMLVSSALKESIKAASLVDDSIYFTVDGMRLMLSSRSEEKEFSQEISMNENKELLNVKSEGMTRAKYSIEYLSKFLNVADPDRPIKVMLSNNYPLKVEYELINKDAVLSFILANRLE